MANRRVLVKRRKTVQNIRKITRTMQLIATARFQAALTQATASKPYTQKLSELVADLCGAATDVEHPLMKTHEDVKESALVVITSQRGLCGGYNGNVLRAATAHIDKLAVGGVDTSVQMFGKKGVLYFKFLRRELAERNESIGDKVQFDRIEPIANKLMGRFERGEIGSVHVAYMRFLSVGRQRAEVLQLLPLQRPEGKGETDERAAKVQYEFSPDPKRLLDELLPATVRVRLFQCFTDAAVSEHIARMVAMKAATDAAGDMIKRLTQQYNRARQTAITMELLDIIGGADAVA